MATSYKVLAQQATTASLVSMYTVPAATETIISSIVVANTSATDRTYRITIQPDNAVPWLKSTILLMMLQARRIPLLPTP
jgi:hypothetical protein